MDSVYRIIHKPSGLFYQPIKSGSHLGMRGKFYTTAANGVDDCKDKVWICLRKGSRAYKKLTNLEYTQDHGDSYKAWFKIPKDEFEKVQLNISQ